MVVEKGKITPEFYLKEQKPTPTIGFITPSGPLFTTVSCEEERLGLFPGQLIIDLGPLAQISDARESIITNKDFQTAIVRNAAEIINSSQKSPSEKVQWLNTLTNALAQIGGRKKGQKREEIFNITQNIITQIQNLAEPLIEELANQGYILIPNDPAFENLKIAEDEKTIFLDPLLFRFNIPGFVQVEEFESRTGKKLYIAEFSEETQEVVIPFEDGFILNKKIWDKITSLKERIENLPENDPQRNELEENLKVLIEALELRLNRVSTSYDPKEKGQRENRIIFEDKKTTPKEKGEETPWPSWISKESIMKIESELRVLARIPYNDDEGETSWIRTITQLENGWLAVGGDRGIVIIDPETGKVERHIDAGRIKITSIAGLTDGNLAVGGDRGIVIIDPKTGKVERHIDAGRIKITSIAGLTDGNLAVGGDRGIVIIYPKTGKVKKHISAVGISTRITSIAGLSDGNLALGQDRAIVIRDPTTGTIKKYIEDNRLCEITSIAELSNGNLAVKGKTKIVIIDPETGKIERHIDFGRSTEITSIAELPDGKLAVVVKDRGIVIIDPEATENNVVYEINKNNVDPEPIDPIFIGDFMVPLDSRRLAIDVSRREVNIITTDPIFPPSVVSEIMETLYNIAPIPNTVESAIIEILKYLKYLKNKKPDTNILDADGNIILPPPYQFIEDLQKKYLQYLEESEKYSHLQRILKNAYISSLWLANEYIDEELFKKILSSPLIASLDLSVIDPITDKEILSKVMNNFSEANILESKTSAFAKLINAYFSVETTPEKKKTFFEKLTQIYEKHPQELAKLSNFTQDELIKFFEDEKQIKLGTPVRAVLIYLKAENAIFLEERQAQKEIKSGESIFEKEVSLSEIIDVEGQSAETGDAREVLIQDAVAAIRNSTGINKGEINITVDYLTEQNELVEEFSYNGTGILDWMKFFVPRETTKKEGDFGFFGAGAFKIFEGVDEVRIKSGDGENIYYFTLQWKEREGKRDLVITDARKSSGNFQGTTITRIKKIDPEKSIPEIEAIRIIDDYRILAGLTAGEKITTKDNQEIPIEIKIQGEPLDVEKEVRLSEPYENFGEIRFVKSSIPPTLARGIGLRIRYSDEIKRLLLQYVPPPLRELLDKLNISIILPDGLPLIKDGSRLAEEDEFLGPLSRKIAGMAIKLAAQELILYYIRWIRKKSVPTWKPEGFPDYWFLNLSFIKSYIHKLLPQIRQLASILIKLDSGETLSAEELELISRDPDNMLPLIIAGVRVLIQDNDKHYRISLSDIWKNNKQIKDKKALPGRFQVKNETKWLLGIIKSKISSYLLNRVLNSLESHLKSRPDTSPPTTTEGDYPSDTTLQERQVPKDKLTKNERKALEIAKKIAKIFGLDVRVTVDSTARPTVDPNKSTLVIHRSQLLVPSQPFIPPPPEYIAQVLIYILAHYLASQDQELLTGKDPSKLFTQYYHKVCDAILREYS